MSLSSTLLRVLYCHEYVSTSAFEIPCGKKYSHLVLFSTHFTQSLMVHHTIHCIYISSVNLQNLLLSIFLSHKAVIIFKKIIACSFITSRIKNTFARLVQSLILHSSLVTDLMKYLIYASRFKKC